MIPNPNTAATADARGSVEPDAIEVVVREEQLRIELTRRPLERVVLRRRVVSEVRQVPVTAQREELEVVRLPLDEQNPARTSPAEPAQPLVIMLSEQVPVIEMTTRAYEKVTVTSEQLDREHVVSGQVAHERAELTRPPAGHAP